MRNALALIPLLAVAVLAEEGSLPFRLGPKGFEEGQTPCRIERLHEGAVEAATGTPDGKWIVWKAGDAVFAHGGAGVLKHAVAAGSRLLGCDGDRIIVAEPLEREAVVTRIDLKTGDPLSPLLRGEDAAAYLGDGAAGLLSGPGLLARWERGEFVFQSLDGRRAGATRCDVAASAIVTFGARAIGVAPREGKPVLLSPGATAVALDPVLEGATGVALSPDRPFLVMSTTFDVGFVSLSSPGLRPLPIEGYTPLAWPSRSAILLTRADGLYLLTLTDDGPAVDEAALRAEEEKRRLAEEEARKRAEAEQARLEAEKQAEAERKRLEQERAGLTDAERARLEEAERQKKAALEQARLEEERRKQAEAEAARLDAEKRRLAEEERKRQEEAARAMVEAEHDLVDFVGLEGARLGNLSDAVKGALAEPDQREEGEEEGTTDWIYASRGLVLTFEDETKQLVRVLAKGKPDFLPAGLKDRFRAYQGKTGKGILLGASRADIEAAYGTPARVLTVGAAEMLRYDGNQARMSFQVERGKLVLILVQREK